MVDGIRKDHRVPIGELLKKLSRRKAYINYPITLWGHKLFASVEHAKGAKEPMIVVSKSIDGHAVYMGPRGRAGVIPAKNYASDMSIGITYAFGKRRTIKTPYMTLANNSNFMVDTNQNQ